MKNIACAAILALLVMSIATPWSTSASSGPAANGSYSFVLDDDFTKTLEFEASSDERGTTTGHMTFRDAAGVGEQDGDNLTRREGDPPAEFFMTADLDSLTIQDNKALMGGTIRDSSDERYIGRWVQLVVEDNGDGRLDKLSWCFCEPEPGGWVPVDAEDPRDEGAWWHWWATDAELRDDVGVQSENIIPGTSRGCAPTPLSGYVFPETRGEGQIQVLP